MRWGGLLAALIAASIGAFASPPVVLDADGDRLLIGRPDEVEAGRDVGLRLTIRLIEGGVEQPWPLEGQGIEQARLLPGARALAITPRHELLEADLATGLVRVLDRDVVGAVGASPDGRHLVYCRGDAPDLEVWQLDLADGKPRPVTRGMAPTWSPAVSMDGGRVIFASGRSGLAALWVVEGGGPPRQLTNLGVVVEPGRPPALTPTPAALSPSLFAKGLVVFEGRDGVHVFDDRGQHVRSLPGTAPHWIVPGRTLGVVVGEPPRVMQVPLTEAKP